MKSNNGNAINITKEKAEYLEKIRIIKKNLVHIQGFPKSVAKTDKLKSYEYFGQYGNIIKATIVYKINPDNNKKAYSAYITYSNEKEAAFAILCVDSLLIEGKIIRAFFGTTKYCSYFLDNNICPIADCLFLHQLITDKDIIIDNNTIFSYNEHIELAKKIIQYSNPITKYLILKMKKPKKNVLPFMDFIFLNESEKEKYFSKGSISYISTNKPEHNNIFINNSIEEKESKYNCNINNKNSYNIGKLQTGNNSIKNLNLNNINNQLKKSFNSYQFNQKDIYFSKQTEPMELYKLLNNSINHILTKKPFFSKVNKKLLKKMEYEYIKQDLAKNGVNINDLFKGCLDCLSDLL